MNIKTTTPKGVEGHGISYSDEQLCAKKLKGVFSEEWTIDFQWCQILFSDLQYQIDEELKVLRIQYNQNLKYWTPQLVKELKEKTKATPSQA